MIIALIEAGMRGYQIRVCCINEKIAVAMKPTRHIFTALISFLSIAFFSCTEELPDVTGKNRLYELRSVSDQNIDGHIKIRERFDKSTQLELVLNNTDPNKTYSAYMYFSNALEAGEVALTLTPVSGQSKSSVTEISHLDSGSLITYDDLLQFDGHISILTEQEHPGYVAQADIGRNALTGRFQQFMLYEGDIEGITGILTVEERESGFSLLTVEIDGGVQGKLHPVTLNFGSINQKSGVAGTLNPVEGNTGISRTNVEQLDGEMPAPYQSLIDFQGFARIHLGEGTEMNTILAQGNIAFEEN